MRLDTSRRVLQRLLRAGAKATLRAPFDLPAAERMVGLRLPMDDPSEEERCELSAPPTVEGTEGTTDPRVVPPLSDLGYL
jgi:hypothetical protein